MISKEQFERYVELQMSGTVNMSDLPYVSVMLFMSEDDVKEIQRRYDELEAKYGG